MALATPLASQAMGLGGSASGTGPKKPLVAGTTSQSQMAGDRPIDSSGGQSVAGGFLKMFKRLGGQAGPAPMAGNTSIAPSILQQYQSAMGVSVPTAYANAVAPMQGNAQAANATDYFNAMYGPQQAQLAQQAADIANQQRVGAERYSGDKANAQQQYGYNADLLANQQDRDVNGKLVDLASLNKYLDAINGSKTNQLSVDKDYLGVQGTMADQALRAAQANTGQQRGLADRAYGQVTGNANEAHDVGVRDLMGNGASGGFGTAQQQGVQGFDTARNQATSAAQLSKDATYQGLGAQDAQSQLANTNQHLDLSHQSNSLQSSYDQYQAGYVKDKADAANQKSYIDSIAKDYGIQGEQLKSSLQNTLRNMGLDYEQTVSQLASAANSTNAQTAATAQAITQQIMQNASQFSTTRITAQPANTQKVKRI